MLGHEEQVATLVKERNDKTLDIEQMKGRIREAEGLARVKPGLFARLTRWLEQLAGLKKEEADILSKITAIEKRHAALRATGLLPDFMKRQSKPILEDEPTPKARRAGVYGGFIAFFLLGIAFAPKRIVRRTFSND